MNLKDQLPEENYNQVKFITNPALVTPLEIPMRTQYDPHNPNHRILPDGYLEMDNVGDPKIVDGPVFHYFINQQGFRSSHFDTLDRNKVNILFGGCSWTFGEGLPEEHTWVRLLTDKMDTIHPDKRATYHNTGYMGSSISLIVKNLIGFCKQYGDPEYMFVCFPDVARSIYWSEYQERYIKMFPSINQFRQKMSPEQAEYSKNYIHENNIMYAADYIRYLEDYCKWKGIKLLWNTWHAGELEMWYQIGFENLIDMQHGETWRPSYWDQSRPFPHENVKNLPYWVIGRDDAHPGTCWTTTQAEMFFQEVMRRWL